MRSRLLNLTGVLLMAAILIVVLPLNLPKWFGYEIYGIVSGSMEPEYPVGSVVYVKDASPREVAVGDVIVFRMGTNTDLTGTHRVIGINEETQEYITKGDANPEADRDPVAFSRLVGKAVLCIPLLGRLSAGLHTTTGIIVCAAIFAGSLACWALAECLKGKERGK